jgi:hypothetical protein
MTANEAERIMQKYLKERVADEIELKKPVVTEDGITETYVHPTVYRGYIIPDSADNGLESAYPFICVRVIKIFNGQSTVTIENSRDKRAFMTIRIDFGTYCQGIDEAMKQIDDGSGHSDLWSMMDKTRLALFKDMIVGDKLSVQYGNFEADVVDESPYPYWNGYIMVNMEIAPIEPEVFDVFAKID